MSPVPEQDLRAGLGIPPEAQRVLIFAESSHWDPDWLLTWDEYFERYARPNLDAALEELAGEPRRVYSLECLFFLQKYWDARPEKRTAIRELVNGGRLRLTSSGVTTPDTLVASTEALLRDWLIGQEWLRERGMTAEPTLAYFPDSFGASHSLPSLLNAAGFRHAAITRVDGMLFMGCDWPVRRWVEWKGSSADRLMKGERSLDFVWRDPSGGEVLCHWNAFTYGQGDMLAHSGLVRMYLYPLAIAHRSDGHVKHQIEAFARALMPVARTPYLFCPIGFDFVAPIPGLVALLDRYNQRHAAASGVWAVNAGLDDYLALVECHRDDLPVVELDPNPYWTGYYAARPTLKKLVHTTAAKLQRAETLLVGGVDAAVAGEVEAGLRRAWQDLVVANHHDFITGTSPDRVAEGEQIPWLQRISEAADSILARLNPPQLRQARAGQGKAPDYSQSGGRLEVRTPHYRLEFDERAGGALVATASGSPVEDLPVGTSNDLRSYADSGGLWRMGMEFVGGRFHLAERASRRPAKLEVRRRADSLEVTTTVVLDGQTMVRRLWIYGDTPVIRAQVRGSAADGRTVTVCFETGIQPHELVMDEPGGIVRRPIARKYLPTFWPVQSMLHLVGTGGRGFALFLGMPGAVACHPDGTLELVTHRNALRETAFGLVHFPGQPASGHDRLVHTADYAFAFTPSGDWREDRLPERAHEMPGWDPDDAGAQTRIEPSLTARFKLEGGGVRLAAAKPAWRGAGIILRLEGAESQGQPIVLRCPGRNVVQAWRCDARERDLERLVVRAGAVRLTMPGSIASVRLIEGGRDGRRPGLMPRRRAG